MAKKKNVGPIDLMEIRGILAKEKIDSTVGIDLAPTSFLSTGMPLVDLALNGGIPWGRITHVWGASATGKTAFGLYIVRCLLAMYPDAVIVYLDSERALSGPFAALIGVTTQNVLVTCPETVEEAFETVERVVHALMAKGVPSERVLFVWDSLASTMPKVDQEGDYDGAIRPGTLAAAISRGIKKLRPSLAAYGAAFLILNQCRDRIVTFGQRSFPCGGNATMFYSDLSIRLESKGFLRAVKGADPYGVRVSMTVDKSRMGLPLRSALYRFYFNTGQLTDIPEVYDTLKRYNLAQTVKSTLTLADGSTYPSREAFEDALQNTPGLYPSLVTMLYKEMQMVPKIALEPDGVDECALDDEGFFPDPESGDDVNLGS